MNLDDQFWLIYLTGSLCAHSIVLFCCCASQDIPLLLLPTHIFAFFSQQGYDMDWYHRYHRGLCCFFDRMDSGHRTTRRRGWMDQSRTCLENGSADPKDHPWTGSPGHCYRLLHYRDPSDGHLDPAYVICPEDWRFGTVCHWVSVRTSLGLSMFCRSSVLILQPNLHRACGLSVAVLAARVDNYLKSIVYNKPDPSWLSAPSYALA